MIFRKTFIAAGLAALLTGANVAPETTARVLAGEPV